jgi:TRAP-type C4-dicarboxylate transport system substrate-binding protein
MLNTFKKMGLAAAMMMTLALQSAKADDITIKLGTLAPEGSSWDLIMKDMGEEWKTAGVKLQVYPGGVLGDEPDIVSKMRIGQIQAAVLTVVGLAQIDKAVQALSIPLLYKSDAESDYVRAKLQPILEKRLLAKGFKVLNWGEAGWVYFFGKQPILSPDDLKKMKFFVWGDDMDTLNIWKSAGYSPVPLSATYILPNLQTGLINSFDTTPLSALSFQWFALAPHMTNVKWAPLIGATVVTTKAWDAIPDDAKPVLLKAAATAGKRFRVEIRAGNEKAIKVMESKGLVVHDVDDATYQQWQKVFETAYPQISGTIVPKDIFDLAVQYRDEYRAKKASKATAE